MFSAQEAQTLQAALPELHFGKAAVASEPLIQYLHHYGLSDLSAVIAPATGVQHTLGFFPSGDFRIACHYFRPLAPQGTAVVVHGYYDHVGLYAHLIRHLLQHHFAVVAFDLPGHGLSSGKIAAIDTFSQYTSALESCLVRMQQASLERPFHLIGQSTGGSVLMDYCLQHCERTLSEIDQVVLLAPLVRPQGWKRGKLLHSLVRLVANGIPRDFAINSHDEAFLRFVKGEDPLQSRRLTVEWVGALKQWLKKIETCGPCKKLVTLIQGTGDATVDWRYNLPYIRRKFPNTQIALVEGARHHLVNESTDFRREIFQRLDEAILASD